MIESFRAHVDAVAEATSWALRAAVESGGAAWDGVVFHAGTAGVFHADDQHPPFHPVPHFARWVPLVDPGHALVFRPGERPRLLRVVMRDFWVEPAPAPEHPFAEVLDVVEVAGFKEVQESLGSVKNLAYVGSDRAWAEAAGFPSAAVEPKELLAALDWQRAYKTPYEAECVRQASARAARGHAAVRAGFEQGLSERALHFAYLEATGHLEHETPYPNIIAWDAMGAVLHYQSKRTQRPDPAHTLLIDAGAAAHGYACDITRTYAREGVHPVFAELLEGMEALQPKLVDAVRPGVPYAELHGASFRGVCELLCEYEVLTCSADDAFERALGFPFYPHGLGHHLGIQVHDVGGKQVDPAGTAAPAPERFPWLRTTRPLEADHLVTIEPGLYFIPLLLEAHRTGEHKDAFNWGLIDVLTPCGGIRIEDDVLVTADGVENLTRPFVP